MFLEGLPIRRAAAHGGECADAAVQCGDVQTFHLLRRPTRPPGGQSTHSPSLPIAIIWTMKKNILRMLVEIGFILFLFYTNLIMGEFERSGMGQKRGLLWTLSDVFTSSNFVIGIVGAGIGYVFFEFLRKWHNSN